MALPLSTPSMMAASVRRERRMRTVPIPATRQATPDPTTGRPFRPHAPRVMLTPHCRNATRWAGKRSGEQPASRQAIWSSVGVAYVSVAIFAILKRWQHAFDQHQDICQHYHMIAEFAQA
jgi:hypothetical protein